MSASAPKLSFAELNLPKYILKALDKIGYESPSPIQAATIPLIMESNDVIGMAQTGTGKTAAFALPILARINHKSTTPECLVLCPTRELAIQVAEAFQAYAAGIDHFHVLPVYGGQDMRQQLRALKRGAQVVVGTPGRVLDHIERGSLDLSDLKTLVLDEADEMLRMGFIDDVETILDETPPSRQIALFSATMPAPIKRVAERYLNEPKEVRIETAVTTNENIEQNYWFVSGTNKLNALTRILEVEDFDGMIIFVRTKTSTAELAEKLNARGFSAAALNGDMNQALRERTIDQLKRGQIDIVVATDVAARGLDVERISHVMNYDIPYDDEAYVHRIGRTGRAGRKGKAILFVTHRERHLLRSIEKTTRQKITQIDLPSRSELIDKRAKDFKQSIEEVIAAGTDEIFLQIANEIAAEQSTNIETVAAALVYQLQKNRPLIPPEEPAREKRETREKRKNNERTTGAKNKPRREKDRNNKAKKPQSGAVPKMDTYKIHVGHNDSVTPREIVGAIANEADLSSKFIGKISIFDDHTLIDLPEGMPKSTAQLLRKTRVCQKPLKLEKHK